MTSLAKRLRALQLRGRRRSGPKRAMPAAAQRVDEARDQRRLGADDDEVDGLARAPASTSAVDVVDGDGDAPRVARDARRCPGAQRTSGRCGERLQRAHDRVLAAPPAPTTRTFDASQPPVGGSRDRVRHSEAMKSSIGIAISVS